MASKKRSGLSSREYAAQQKGGTLNYKTGKISVPAPAKKYNVSYQPSESGDDADMGYIGTPEYQSYLNQNNGKAMPDAEYNTKNNDFNSKKASSSKPKSIPFVSKPVSVVPTTQRYQASIAANAPKSMLGNAVSTGRNLAGSIWDELKGLGTSGAISNPVSTINKLVEDIQTGMNTPGGNLGYDLTDSNAFGANDRGEVLGVETQPFPFASWDTFNQTQGNPTTNRTDTRINQSRQNSQPTNPFIQPTGGISSVYTPMAQQMGFGQDVPSQPENGTVRRPIGMGEFSSGQYANGGGGYGLGGGFNGNSMDNEQSLINKILGINTAQAAEQPSISEMNQQQSNIIPDNLLTPAGVKVWGSQSPGAMTENGYQESEPSFDTQMAQSEQEYSDLKNQEEPLLARLMQMAGLGETAQASGGQVLGASAPTRGNLSQREYASQNGQAYDAGSDYNRIYDKQEKSQKKASDEYLKSIDRQYAEAQTSGTADLEKAKQQDLLKLGAQFNFGNSDPNDEQRIQYQGRTNNDYAGQVVDMIKKLASAKSNDVSTAQQNLQKVLLDIQNNRIAQQNKVAELQTTQQQKDYANRLALLKLMGYGNNNYDTGTGAVDIFGNPA